jgi:hypothetical protein
VGLEISKPIGYSILNLQGQSITSGKLTENTNLNFAAYQTGLYFINFITMIHNDINLENLEGLIKEAFDKSLDTD